MINVAKCNISAQLLPSGDMVVIAEVVGFSISEYPLKEQLNILDAQHQYEMWLTKVATDIETSADLYLPTEDFQRLMFEIQKVINESIGALVRLQILDSKYWN